jgi:hypothetical protein
MVEALEGESVVVASEVFPVVVVVLVVAEVVEVGNRFQFRLG